MNTLRRPCFLVFLCGLAAVFRILRSRMFSCLLDPDPSNNKQKRRKALILCCSVTSFFNDFFVFENWCKCSKKQVFKNNFLLASSKALAKSGIRIRIRSQMCGSKDPYPDPGSVPKCHGSGTLVSWRRELMPTAAVKACFLFYSFSSMNF
jgi:hypothetical protein